MKKKQFKTESQKLLDMMINSIYTHKEIFLRELISNASDAIDKLYYRSLQDGTVGLSRSDYFIKIDLDKNARTIKIRDNGIGMTSEELETNLGTIAKSGSFDFKKENEKKEDVDVIGQFGVGFYSAFMVADKIHVTSRPFGSDAAYTWESEGVDGYTVGEGELDSNGTEILLHLKDDVEEENYSEFLEPYRIQALIKKYSDYIRYPIKMDMEKEKLKEGSKDEYEKYTETETLNSMVPLWKKSPKEVKEEEYNSFYTEKFYDYEAPIKVIHSKTEGLVSFDSLLFIPKHAPYNYYSKDYEKGLALYSSGVMITEKCKDLLPDYFSFVHGLVDSADLSLNISREVLQHDHQLKTIAKAVEKKIHQELKKMMDDDREKYLEFYKAFGTQLKYGLYADYGMHKDSLVDLILFISSMDKQYVSLHDYVSRMKEDQKEIYYACGETVDKIALLPKAEAVIDKGYEVLFLTEDVDEFALKMLNEFEGKNFKNVSDQDLDLSTEEEKETLKKKNEDEKDLLSFMKEAIGDGVKDVVFTNNLKDHPVALSTDGALSVEMQKVLSKMPGSADNGVKAEVKLEINMNHPIAEKLNELYKTDKEKVKTYAKILYNQAKLIDGLTVENPSELCEMICTLL